MFAKLNLSLQALGRTLMLPIAVLPVAALILRLGQDDLLGLPFLAAAGSAVFANLGLLFAAGVAIGLARENHGAAGLAGIVAFLIASNGAQALVSVPHTVGAGLDAASQALAVADFRAKSIARLGVPLGILSGLIAGLLYNRYATIRVPEFLSFFGGRRFVPIVSGLAGVGLALVFGYAWPAIGGAIDALSTGLAHAGWIGMFVYGVLNRLLLVTGLHHIINNVVWFIVGSYGGATGDLNRFFAGDPSAGGFMAGFFPVMMFGLPAACLAMYRAARPEQRAGVAGMYLSLALTSFLTGVTEPIEFSFMFVAPVLYALHALLTGAAMALMSLLDVHLGFGFSAGLLDYVLNYGRATHPLRLIPVGLAYAAIYYGIFSFAIRRFDLRTPGRSPDTDGVALVDIGDVSDRATLFVAALGGADNLDRVEACTTRLRIQIADPSRIDEAALGKLGARGVIRPGPGSLQVVLGPVADRVACEINGVLGGLREATPEARPQVVIPVAPASVDARLLGMLGGMENIEDIQHAPDRTLIALRRPLAATPSVEGIADVRALAMIDPLRIHLLLNPAG